MIWKACEFFPAYEVSERGDVRRARDGRPRKSAPNTAGYACYGLWRDGEQTTVQASHLVAYAFIGPKPFDGAQICHNDGTRTNDHYSNLRWDSAKGNADDRTRHGTNSQTKLQEGEVIEIRRLKSLGETQRSISRKFNVAQSLVSDIIRRKLWAQVS